MIGSLIESLHEYKTQMSYEGIDFDGDKPMQYKELRLKRAEIYNEDITLFGPVHVDCLPDDFNDMSKEEKDLAKERVKLSKELISKGTKRIMEKVNEVRQSFSKAAISGRRSGSERLFLNFTANWYYCGGWGLANVSPLTYGIASDDIEQESINASEQELQDVVDYSNAPTLLVELNVADAAEVEDDEESEAISTNSANKRPAVYRGLLIINENTWKKPYLQLKEIKCYWRKQRKMQDLEKR